MIRAKATGPPRAARHGRISNDFERSPQSQTGGAFLKRESGHAAALEQPQLPATQTSRPGVPQSLFDAQPQWWLCESHEFVEHSVFAAHSQKPLCALQVSPKPACAVQVVESHPKKQWFFSHRPVVEPHTAIVAPSPPKRRRVTASGGKKHVPPSVGAGVAQSPIPPASMQTSPGKQSRSVVHAKFQKLANATQSSFVLHASIGFSQRFRVGLHLYVATALASVPMRQSASVSQR